MFASFFHSEVEFNSVCIRNRITSDINFEIKRNGSIVIRILTHCQCIKTVTTCYQKSCQLIWFPEPTIAELEVVSNLQNH